MAPWCVGVEALHFSARFSCPEPARASGGSPGCLSPQLLRFGRDSVVLLNAAATDGSPRSELGRCACGLVHVCCISVLLCSFLFPSV